VRTTYFKLDYEAVRTTSDPLQTIENIIALDLPADWERRKACWGCENWKPIEEDGKQLIRSLPRRPGAPNASESCFGCYFAMFDDVRPPRPEQDQDAPRPRRRNVMVLDGRQIRFDAKGKLRCEWVSGGYRGKRDADRAGRRPELASFTPRPRLPERVRCKCGSTAQVQRYWCTTGPEAVPMVVVACEAKKTCGRWKLPESEWEVSEWTSKLEKSRDT
jgi:hypothetical protein